MDITATVTKFVSVFVAFSFLVMREFSMSSWQSTRGGSMLKIATARAGIWKPAPMFCRCCGRGVSKHGGRN
jgi:hypothetical protein